ncbi:MAG: tRNA (N6-isopentenyl adenosine(37)-C2)-methylthiotransferase MiaB [Deltaproteobacteria bacterium]|nr:tRNA (N6-isopentenyl adenosine(37)-C2)-methylthiotransferase MiaB [Deltaproteobacteria bacterium]
MGKAFSIQTMGCQMNEYDSDYLAQSLIQCGFSPSEDLERADLILINTCTVRAKPQQKAYSLLGRLSAMKSRNPALVIGVVGCLAQQEGADLMRRFPQLDLVVGPRELGRMQEIIRGIDDDCGKLVATNLDTIQRDPIMDCQGYAKGRISGYISIMEGCNNFCSYCVVPYVRGREVSRSPQGVLAEAKRLISDGVKEITLLGQNVNSYCFEERQKKWDFPRLLEELSALKDLLRLRFTTSHPKDLSHDLIHCFRDLPSLCPHIHLPFQAGSNTVLKRMRRGYTRESYMGLISKLRKMQPDMAITSDVMVGFPGETEKDFEWTLDLIKRVQFDSLFSFKYSDRKNTAAEKMDRKLDEPEKARRLQILQALQRQITLKKNRALEGHQVEVLVEGESKRGGQLTGRTGTNKVVNFLCNRSSIGNIVNVVIRQGLVNSLGGELSR